MSKDYMEVLEPDILEGREKSEYFSISQVDNLGIKDMVDTEKPREKLQYYGVSALSDTELMAILLGSGTKGSSALDLANKVFLKARNHEYLMSMPVQELMKIKGIGLSKACTIVAGLELGKRLSVKSSIRNIAISSPADIHNLFNEMLKYEDVEHFISVFLDVKNRITGWLKISTGDLNRSIVNPREVYKEAVKRSANSLIFVHNHPSGDPRPSKDDIAVTKRLIEAGEILGIGVHDHIIIGYNDYFSMKAENLI